MTDQTADAATLVMIWNGIDDLLQSEDKWTKEVGARTASGKAINPNDPQATCWCLMGASYRVTHSLGLGKKAADDLHRQIMMGFRNVLNDMGQAGITLGEYNDDSNFTSIKALIEAARQAIGPESDAGSGSAAAA